MSKTIQPKADQPYFDELLGPISSGDWFPSPAHVMRRSAILDCFSAYPPGLLLEIGCGAGRFLADWHRLGHVGEAVDLDPVARGLASECVEQFALNFEVGSEHSAREFDYLVCTEVLEHLDDPDAMLEEWVRALKPGGYFLATVPAFQSKWGASDEWAGHVQRFEPDNFHHLLESKKLTVVYSKLYGFPVGSVLRTLGNMASKVKMGSSRSPIAREQATLASGRDRTIEIRVAPIMRSPFGKAALRAGIVLQRRFNRGHGLVVIAKKHDG